jgi:hypothetical protein
MLAQAIWTLAFTILIVFAGFLLMGATVSICDELGDERGMYFSWFMMAIVISLVIWAFCFVIHRWLQYGCG